MTRNAVRRLKHKIMTPIEKLQKEIAALEIKYKKSVSRHVYVLGQQLRDKKELLNLLLNK